MKTLKNILQSIRKEFFRKRGLSFYFAVGSFVFCTAMLVAYNLTGISTFTPVLSGKVLALIGVCMGLAVLFSAVEIKAGKYILYLFCLWMWLEYLFSEASYISNVLVSIDGNSFTSGFILTAVFGLLGWVSALISAIVQKKEIGSSKAPADAAAAKVAEK